MVTANAATRLLEHYVDKFRRLPWRSAPGEPAPEPYLVWLSEVMLQQTTVATVIPRFERFVARWPTIEALADASDEDILGEWAGLGYYARARNLIACAREVARRGEFPRTAAELRRLPGIGAYTSAAIAAIAFGEQAAAVDTNVERVVARLHAFHQPPRGEIEQAVLDLMTGQRPGDIVQALMDLGATICRPKAPKCVECPLSIDCVAHRSGEPEGYPQKRSRAERPHRHGIAYWSERDGMLWLVRRPPTGLLGGMVALPGTDWSEKQASHAPPLATIRHVFTHFSLDLRVEARASPVGEGWWHPVDQLADAGLPSLYMRAVRQVLESRRSLAA